MYQSLDVSLAYRILGGGQLINVSTLSKDGVADVMTAAWNTLFNVDMPLVVLDQGHTTTQNILDTAKFVISVPDEHLVKTAVKVGSAHGRDTGDKFVFAGVTPELSDTFKIPVIPGALAYIECELADMDLFKKNGIALGKAVSLKVKADLWDDKEQNFKEGYTKLLHSVNEEFFYADGRFVRS